MARLADRAFAETGDVGLLVNNAGVGGGGYVWETSEKEWRWVLGVNVMGVVHGLRRFVPRMLEAEARGRTSHVVNTASIAGWLAPPMFGVYSVSKHAVVALTETLFHDLRMAGSGIGVSLLCPAFVPTGISRSERNRPADLSDAAPETGVPGPGPGGGGEGGGRREDRRRRRGPDDLRRGGGGPLLRLHPPADPAFGAGPPRGGPLRGPARRSLRPAPGAATRRGAGTGQG